VTVTTLRPASDQRKANVTLSTGTAMWSLLDDAPADDATYIVGTAGFNYPNCYAFVQPQTGVLSVSATQRIKQVRYRARIRLDAADPGHSASLGLGTHRSDSSDTFIEKFSTSNASTFQDITGAWRPKPQTGHGTEWTTALVEATWMYMIFWYSIGTVHRNIRVSELYFDVDVRTQPTVTGVTETGHTSTTQPTISWTYNTNADGDQQVAYQVKIFSSAQYSTTGFDPDISASTWDSTVLAGSAASLQVGTDLVNGTTYKAYVKAATDFNGSNWYTTWALSSAFTIALTPPPTPFISLTATGGPPGYRAIITVTAPLNLLTADAASFETSVNQWTAETNCSISRVNTDAADGTWSLQLSSTAAGAMSATSGQDPFLGYHVKGGAQYTALASFRAGTTGRSCTVGIRWLNSAGATIQTDMGVAITDTNAGYTQASATFTAPATAVTAVVRVNVAATGGAAELHRVDKVSLMVGTSTTWTAGGYATSQVVTLERGERLPQARGQARNWVHPQVATGGSTLRTSNYGFRIVDDGGLDTIQYQPITVNLLRGSGLVEDCDLLHYNQPAGAILWGPRSGAAASLLIGSWLYAGAYDSDWQFPALFGLNHTLSFWAWTVTGTVDVTPKIDWIGDDATTVRGTTTGNVVTLTTTPQQVIVTGVCSALATNARGVLTNHTSATPTGIYVTRVGFRLGLLPVDDHIGRGGPLVWTPVRFVDQAQTSGIPFGYTLGQTITFSDYEIPPSRPVYYRVRQSVTVGTTVVASNFGTFGVIYLTAPTRPLIFDPLQPERAYIFSVQYNDTYGPVEDSAEFHPLGRDDDPVFLRDWLGHQVGLSVVAATDEELLRLDQLIRTNTGILIKWSDGGQWYVRVTDYPVTRVRPGIFKYSWSGRIIQPPVVS
jgi:hypothetical protein